MNEGNRFFSSCARCTVVQESIYWICTHFSKHFDSVGPWIAVSRDAYRFVLARGCVPGCLVAGAPVLMMRPCLLLSSPCSLLIGGVRAVSTGLIGSPLGRGRPGPGLGGDSRVSVRSGVSHSRRTSGSGVCRTDAPEVFGSHRDLQAAGEGVVFLREQGAVPLQGFRFHQGDILAGRGGCDIET